MQPTLEHLHQQTGHFGVGAKLYDVRNWLILSRIDRVYSSIHSAMNLCYNIASCILDKPTHLSDHYPIGLDIALNPEVTMETSTMFQKQTVESMASTLNTSSGVSVLC